MAWTAPKTWTPGEVVTAAELNQQVRDNLLALSGTYDSYTPTWTAATTNPTLGNGILTGQVALVGSIGFFRISLTIGSTTNLGVGQWQFGLPFSVAAPQGFNAPIGQAVLYDVSSGAAYSRTAARFAANNCVMRSGDGSITSPTAPFAWAAGDTIQIQGSCGIVT